MSLDAPIVKDRPKCEAPGCGMPAIGSTNGINHCNVHLIWVNSGDAEGDIARAKGVLQPPEPVTGYTCRCGAAWDAAGNKTLPGTTVAQEDTPAGHFRQNHSVFQRIGRGSLRDFLA